MTHTPRITVAHLTALADLDRALINVTAPVPCRSSSPTSHSSSSPWLSEEPDERAAALPLCQDCPALAECAAAGHYQTHGIWGGVDRTRHLTPWPGDLTPDQPEPEVSSGCQDPTDPGSTGLTPSLAVNPAVTPPTSGENIPHPGTSTDGGVTHRPPRALSTGEHKERR